MKTKLIIAILALTAAARAQTPATNSVPNETQAQRDQRMKWFTEARFGMFIHWGIYSVPAGEWNGKTNYGEWFLEETHMPVSQYGKFAGQFNPVQFDAKEWVRMAKDAGMKYIVITSKHHDGFCMWPTEQTDWCIKSTPFHRDPLAELSKACNEAGIKFCTYYSIMDWHSSDWGKRRAWNDVATGTPDMDHYTDYMKRELKELITNYHPGILWFDGEWESPWTQERGVDLYSYLRTLDPTLIVNNRIGKARAGMNGMNKGEGVGDYGTPEQNIPATGFGTGVAWESCMTMNNHWGYNKNDQDWKSTQTLVHNLIDCASKGGNYLLNVGPTSQGVFPPAIVERLAEIGKWTSVNGEAVYDTTASPFPKQLPWGRCTVKTTGDKTTLYLHVFDWPSDGKLLVPGLNNKIESASLLAGQVPVAVQKTDDGVVISLPAAAPDKISSTVVLQFAGKPDVSASPTTQAQDGSVLLLATDANLHGTTIQYESGGGHDNIGFWTDPSDWIEWTFRLKQPGKFNVSAVISTQNTTSFEVSVAGQTLRCTASATGSWTTFKPVAAGVVDIPAAGDVTLAIHAIKDGWDPINVKSLKLTPVANNP